MALLQCLVGRLVVVPRAVRVDRREQVHREHAVQLVIQQVDQQVVLEITQVMARPGAQVSIWNPVLQRQMGEFFTWMSAVPVPM